MARCSWAKKKEGERTSVLKTTDRQEREKESDGWMEEEEEEEEVSDQTLPKNIGKKPKSMEKSTSSLKKKEWCDERKFLYMYM